MLIHAEDSSTQGFVGSMPPLGLAWLATSLLREGISVRILDPQVENLDFEEVFGGERPSVLGVSATTAARFRAFDYIRMARARDPKILTVIGGPHVTCAAHDTLEHLPELDAVVRGEGEIPFTEICRRHLDGRRDFENIGSLSWRRGGDLLHNEPGERVKDLDSLGFPARELLANELYDLENEFIGTRAFHLMASRGCPYQCSFCSAGAIWDHKVSFRTPGHVVEEMIQLRDKFGADGLRFMDALVTVRKSFTMGLCEEIHRRDAVMPWECEIRVDTVDEEMLTTMREAGCYYLDFGVESINPVMLKRMKKRITPEQIENILKLSHKLGFKTKVFFTIGHIEETVDQAMETLRFIRKNKRYITRIGGGVGINIFPGTEVEYFAKKEDLMPEGFHWSKPYSHEDNLHFSTAPSVPILIQPQFTWRELHLMRRRHLFQKLRDPEVVMANLRKLRGRAGLRRLKTLARGVFGRSKSESTDSQRSP